MLAPQNKQNIKSHEKRAGTQRLPIEFEVSRDVHALQQYYALRERCYRQELQLAAFDGSEDERERQGLILPKPTPSTGIFSKASRSFSPLSRPV